MSKRLEDVTVESLWDFYQKVYPPPPGLPSEDLEAAKNFYMSGLAAMLAIAQRLRTEPVERQRVVLDKLQGEVVAMGGLPAGTLN